MLHGSTRLGWGSATAPFGSDTTTVSASNGRSPFCANRAVLPSMAFLSHAVWEPIGPA